MSIYSAQFSHYRQYYFLQICLKQLYLTKLEITIARQVLPYDRSHADRIDYTNKRHLFKLPYTHHMKEFILLKKVLKLQNAIITRCCKVYVGILYYFIQCQ
jgi:hypothetical protein